jgi:redox-sensitive bicupin YhaK (pirin superfamily)
LFLRNARIVFGNQDGIFLRTVNGEVIMLETAPAVIRVPSGLDLPGLVTNDLTFEIHRARIDPFLVISLFDMTGPVFPPHPHAGFSVATYIFPESEIGFWNQDTLGNRNRIEPGSLHMTVAGSGIMHEETVSRSGQHARGFQIWIDHAAEDRLVTPAGLHLASGDVPTFTREGVTFRVLLGSHEDVSSPLDLPTAVRLTDIEMAPGAALEEEIGGGRNWFAWVRSGEIETGARSIQAGSVIFPGEGQFSAWTQLGARLTIFGGRPLDHAAVPAGPFVASDEAQAAAFRADYAAGRMGQLVPFDQRLLDAEFDQRSETGG